jgi:hypothetical protein
MSRTEGYTVPNKIKDEHILEELKVEPITTYLQQYKAQWKKSHIKRTTDNRWRKLITTYKPPGKRSV